MNRVVVAAELFGPGTFPVILSLAIAAEGSAQQISLSPSSCINAGARFNDRFFEHLLDDAPYYRKVFDPLTTVALEGALSTIRSAIASADEVWFENSEVFSAVACAYAALNQQPPWRPWSIHNVATTKMLRGEPLCLNSAAPQDRAIALSIYINEAFDGTEERTED